MLKFLNNRHLFAAGLFLWSAFCFAEKFDGKWTYNDYRQTDHQMLVEVKKTANGYEAYVISAPGVCKHCKGVAYQKPIKGMKILWDLKQRSKNLFDEGYFLDTHSGRIYRARIKLHGKQLFIRSYLGLPVMGQTQIWQRYHP